MRTKDDKKQQALFEATVKLVNEIGFAASSVSKIAKEAGVSPATLYTYYKNKEDLLISTYVDIKMDLSRAIMTDFDDTLPIRDILRTGWFNMVRHIQENRAYYQFIEQFTNSPYSELVNKEELEKHFIKFLNVFQCGIDQKIIKNVDITLIGAYMFHPVSRFTNPSMCGDFQLTDETLEIAFTMAWDAIKL